MLSPALKSLGKIVHESLQSLGSILIIWVLCILGTLLIWFSNLVLLHRDDYGSMMSLNVLSEVAKLLFVWYICPTQQNSVFICLLSFGSNNHRIFKAAECRRLTTRDNVVHINTLKHFKSQVTNTIVLASST